MSTVKMVAILPHEYDRVMRAPGDEFDVEEKHVALMKHIGRAKLKTIDDQAPAPIKPPRRVNGSGHGRTSRSDK